MKVNVHFFTCWNYLLNPLTTGNAFRRSKSVLRFTTGNAFRRFWAILFLCRLSCFASDRIPNANRDPSKTDKKHTLPAEENSRHFVLKYQKNDSEVEIVSNFNKKPSILLRYNGEGFCSRELWPWFWYDWNGGLGLSNGFRNIGKTMFDHLAPDSWWVLAWLDAIAQSKFQKARSRITPRNNWGAFPL